MKMRRTYQNRYEPEARQSLARIYWNILVVLFTAAVVASIAYGAWEFTRPFNQSASEVTVGTPKAPLNRADIQKILDGFDARSQQFNARQSAPAPRDPS